MSDQDDNEALADEVDHTESQSETARAVNRGSLVISVVIGLSLVWYLMADRFTPYTSQARIAGYVVGVAPKVAGAVTDLWVENNHEVDKGQRLFEIDPSQYQIALEKAQSGLESAYRQVGAGSAAVDSYLGVYS